MLSLGVVSCLVPMASAEAQIVGNNVLVIVMDDIGVDNIGAYAEGANPPPTPNLDQLALGGVLFRNAWANPMCSTTRACIMTGKHSFRTGVGAVVPPSPGLRPGETTIPSTLDARGSGYRHAAFGKWHLADPAVRGTRAPNDAGWSHFVGFVLGFSDYFNWPRTVNGVTAQSTTYATTQIVDDALTWIQNRSGSSWVCYVGVASAHLPYHAPPSGLHTRNLAGLDPGATPLPFYHAMVEAMDTEIGRLIAGLGAQQARTNIIVTSDNGTPGVLVRAPFPTNVGKGTPYEGGLNVPLIISGPDVASPGREVDTVVSAVDVYGTVLELANTEPEPFLVNYDSVSMVPYLRDPAQAPLRQVVYAELFDGVATDFSCLRNDRYKMIRHRSGGAFADLLYDLDNDPYEANNLTTSVLSATEQSNLSQLIAAMDQLFDPAPAFVKSGPENCIGSNGRQPDIRGLDSPVIGGTYRVRLRRAPGPSSVFIMIGGSNKFMGALPLPLPLSLLGGTPDCLWMTSGEFSFPAVTNNNGRLTVPITLPAEPLLSGARVYHQFFVVDPGAPNNPLGLTSTPVLEAHVGQ